MILHLIRHPRPVIAPGICYGQLDIPAENPPPGAERLRQHLVDIPAWSSPLRRCQDFAAWLKPDYQCDARLMEMNFGDWEGRPWDDIPRPELDAWAADVAGYVPPNGESAQQVLARVSAFLADQEAPEIALVTHAGVIRLLLSHLQNRPLTELLSEKIEYGELLPPIPFVIF